MKHSVKFLVLGMILFASTFEIATKKIKNIRLTTAKSHLHPESRKLLLGGITSMFGGKKKQVKDNGETTIMLLGVMERQQQIQKIHKLVETLQRNLDDLRRTIDSKVSELSVMANASLGGDKFLIDAK